MGACLGKPHTAEAEGGESQDGGEAMLSQVTDPVVRAVIRSGTVQGDYNVGLMSKVLGAGKWGSVKMISDKTASKTKFALKTLNKQMLLKRPARISRTIEVECYAKSCPGLGRRYVALLEAVYEDAKNLYLVMEHCPGGDLYTYITDNLMGNIFSEENIRTVMRQAFEAVQHLHANGICHRDLKPENMLFDADGNLKLCDFGSAAEFTPGQVKDRDFVDFVATAYYVAPEVFTHHYGATCDIWALGVTIFVLLIGPPSANLLNLANCKVQKEWQNLQQGKIQLPKGVSPELTDLMGKLLEPDPNTRLSAEEVRMVFPYGSGKHRPMALDHPWFTGRVARAGEELDLEGSFRGIKMFVVARKLQNAMVLLVGVYLKKDQLVKLEAKLQAQEGASIAVDAFQTLLGSEFEARELIAKIEETRRKLGGGAHQSLGVVELPKEHILSMVQHTLEYADQLKAEHKKGGLPIRMASMSRESPLLPSSRTTSRELPDPNDVLQGLGASPHTSVHTTDGDDEGKHSAESPQLKHQNTVHGTDLVLTLLNANKRNANLSGEGVGEGGLRRMAPSSSALDLKSIAMDNSC